MAKGKGGQRRVPSTPASSAEPPNPAAELPAVSEPEPPKLTRSGFVPLPEQVAPSPRQVALIRGTGCLAGHPRGAELDGGVLGRVPSAKTTWIGLAILVWCGAGLFFVSPAWLMLALLGAVLWWIFSFLVQRRMGHRGRCLRTRAWRQAWGGMVPQTKDPTRPADGED